MTEKTLKDVMTEELVSFDSQDLNALMMEALQVLTGLADPETGVSFESEYDRLHIQLPFLEINPPIGAVNMLVFTAINQSKTMPVPDRAQLVRFRSNSNFYVGGQGLIAASVSGDITDGQAPIYNPEGWYYCAGKKGFSVLSQAAQVVSAEFFIQL